MGFDAPCFAEMTEWGGGAYSGAGASKSLM